MPPKTVYLMRHAESEGQASKKNGIERTDKSLLDCRITKIGEVQARYSWDDNKVLPELIVVSPLTRAIQTALIAFEKYRIPTVCHPDLRESGSSKLPENTFRGVEDLFNDKKLKKYHGFREIDFGLLEMGVSFPETPRKKTVKYLYDDLLTWLYKRPEKTILLVTHYNVIKNILPSITEPVENAKIYTTVLYYDFINEIPKLQGFVV